MRPNPRVVMIGTVVVLAIGVLYYVSSTESVGQRSATGAAVTQVLGTAEPDSSASFELILKEGDPEHESAHVFEALGGMPGLASAGLDVATEVLTVEFDSSAATEADIRARLLQAGYVAPGAEDATPAELSEDGSVQRIAIVDDHGFSPAFIKLASGVPAELEFGPGTECRVSIGFPELGIEQDISAGAVVKLPALEPGTYAIVCSGDAQEGALLVE